MNYNASFLDAAGNRVPEALSHDASTTSDNDPIDSHVIDEQESPSFKVFAPAILGRYLITSSLEHCTPVVKELKRGSKLDALIHDFHVKSGIAAHKGGEITTKIAASQPIYCRDFIVLLGLIHIQRTPALHLAHLDGGLSFMLSDLREILKLSSGGANSRMLRESLERLQKIKFSLIASQNGQDHIIETFNIFDAVDTGLIKSTADTGTKRIYNSRSWHVAFSSTFLHLLMHSNNEQTAFDLEDLIKYRKNTLALSVQIHYKTASYGQFVFDKRLIVLMNNTNTPIDSKRWRKDLLYRLNMSNKIRRALSAINVSFKSAIKNLLTLPSQLVTYSHGT